MELVRTSKPEKRIKQSLSDGISILCLEERFTERIDIIADKRDESKQIKMRVRNKIEEMRDLNEGERLKTSFFRKVLTSCAKEEMFMLADANKGGTKTKNQEEINEVVNYRMIEKDQETSVNGDAPKSKKR